MSLKIIDLVAYQVYDSRGRPTIEAEITIKTGKYRASVPSGASKGKYEALELRDLNKEGYDKIGVCNAIKNINEIIKPALLKADVSIDQQKLIDKIMIDLDGTENKSRLGANSILAVSMVIAKAASGFHNKTLAEYLNSLLNGRKMCIPFPFFNIINGGQHSGNELAFQEFMIVPKGATSFEEAMYIGCKFYQSLKERIRNNFGADSTSVGDEGGFAPKIRTPEEALNLIVEIIDLLKLKEKVAIALDIAASEFYENGKYNISYKWENNHDLLLTPKEYSCYLDKLIQKYPIISIEDPFDQDDLSSWNEFKKKVGIQIVGDDLTVTNVNRIKLAHENDCCNTLLLKINQIGTLSESIDAANLAFSFGWNVMVSHRSGDTEESFIADLAVALGCKQIKAGAPCRSERLSKYNQLLRLSHQNVTTMDEKLF